MPPGDSLRVLYLAQAESDTVPALDTLRRAGFAVACDLARDRAAFTARLVEHYDVVLAELALPGWTGMEALALLRERAADLPFILVTGSLDSEAAVACVRQGASDYVRNDHLDRLPQAVTHALAARRLRAEHHQARRALADSERRFRSLALATSDLIWITDAAGRMRGRLARWQSYTGQTQAQLAGSGWLEVLHPDDRARMRESLERGLADALPFEHELRIRAADGNFHVFAFKAVPVKTAEGALLEWIGSAKDVTAHRELERQFLHAQRLEAVGQLAGGIAHDFNNILTSVLGFSQFLLDQFPADSPYRADVEEIYRAAELAAALTRKLLAFSRRQPVNPQVLDLNEATQDACRMLTRLLGEDVRLELDTSARPAVVKADPGQLEQVVLNLAVNARDAMPQGGRLRIRTFTSRLADGLLHGGGVVPPGEYAVLSVADEGSGMTPDVLGRIFEPFFTTKGGTRGSGLGLSSVYGIVQQAGGHIVVQSTAGRGSTFDLYFPAAEAEPAPATVQRPVGAVRGDEAILLVEDQPAIRLLVQRTLTRAGYSVLPAENGDQARSLAKQAAHLDLIVMDVLLPGERGPRVACDLRVLHPAARLLFISGNLDVADEAGLPDGPQWFLQKPFNPEQLLSTVRAALDAPLHSGIAPGAQPT
jgi:PAS domain S-box-containing protein